MKTCRVCNNSKPIQTFPLRRGKPDTWCYDCQKEYKQKYWEQNKCRIAEVRKNHYATNRDEYLEKCKNYYRTLDPDIVREKGWRTKLKNEYGITPEEYNTMFESQAGVCAICHRPERSVTKGKIVKLAIDHDHNNGKIRGLLCRACNTAVGLLEEDENVILSAVDYLRKNRRAGR